MIRKDIVPLQVAGDTQSWIDDEFQMQEGWSSAVDPENLVRLYRRSQIGVEDGGRSRGNLGDTGEACRPFVRMVVDHRVQSCVVLFVHLRGHQRVAPSIRNENGVFV